MIPQRTDTLDTLSEKTEVLSPSPETQEISDEEPAPFGYPKADSVWYELELYPKAELSQPTPVETDPIRKELEAQPKQEPFSPSSVKADPVWSEPELHSVQAVIRDSIPDNIVTQDVDEKSIHGVPPPPYSPPQYTVVGPPCGPNCYKLRLLKRYVRGNSNFIISLI